MKFLLAVLLLTGRPLFAQDPDTLKRFDYDRSAPLDIKSVSVEKRGNASVQDISFASPKGGRVPAFLVVPEGKGPFAAILWGHWYWSNSPMRNRKEFLDEAAVLARSGVVSLLTDGPVARPGHVENNAPLNEDQITDLIQAIAQQLERDGASRYRILQTSSPAKPVLPGDDRYHHSYSLWSAFDYETKPTAHKVWRVAAPGSACTR